MSRGLTFAPGELAAETWGDEGDSQDVSAYPSLTQSAHSQSGALGFVGENTTNLTRD